MEIRWYFKKGVGGRPREKVLQVMISPLVGWQDVPTVYADDEE
jgi:hypothetical protein